MNTESAVLALIHDQIGQELKAFFKNPDDAKALDKLIVLESNVGKLSDQLIQVSTPEEREATPKVSIALLFDFVGSSVPALITDFVVAHPLPFDPIKILKDLEKFVKDRLKFFPKAEDLLKAITGGNAAKRKAGVEDLFKFDTLNTDSLRQLIGDEIGVVLSLATIVNVIEGAPDAAQDIIAAMEKALLDYFFKKEGFKTLDGTSIVSPVHLTEASATGTDPLKSLFSKTTGEQYVRDMIRVAVEAAYDKARDLKGTYDDTVTKVKERVAGNDARTAVEKKLITWLKGFSSMAESAAMRIVEMTTQGVSGFQTNTLISASAGTFAGTVARKLAQHCFLKKLLAELP